jgi:hypothetical protein
MVYLSRIVVGSGGRAAPPEGKSRARIAPPLLRAACDTGASHRGTADAERVP